MPKATLQSAPKEWPDLETQGTELDSSKFVVGHRAELVNVGCDVDVLFLVL